MAREKSDIPEELSANERARLRHRDRKRRTQMVVDNAAVKRTTLALAQRRASPTGATPPDVTDGP